LNGYEVLNIPATATRDEIRAAYRELARRWHPDRFMPGPERDWANEKMAVINSAYRACLGGLRDARMTRDQESEALQRAQALIDSGKYQTARKLLMGFRILSVTRKSPIQRNGGQGHSSLMRLERRGKGRIFLPRLRPDQPSFFFPNLTLQLSAEAPEEELPVQRIHHCHSFNRSFSRLSISIRVCLQAPGFSRPALNIRFTSRPDPTGSIIFSMVCGKAKCVPCSYNHASNVLSCGMDSSLFCILRI